MVRDLTSVTNVFWGQASAGVANSRMGNHPDLYTHRRALSHT